MSADAETRVNLARLLPNRPTSVRIGPLHKAFLCLLVVWILVTAFVLYISAGNKEISKLSIPNNADWQIVGNGTKRPPKSALKTFSHRLAQYYQLSYANLPTMGDSPKHVKDVWVPLQIDGRNEGFLAADRINHTELLNRLKSNSQRNVALVKGDPGMGKTTIAKKIAYEWAANYGAAAVQQFSLVLAVPLRSAGKSNRLDQLAMDYMFSIGNGVLVRDISKAELIAEITQLESQLLVILDGLDEYRSFGESPFKDLFAAPFERVPAYRNVPAPLITFKLIITSRPYGCKTVNEGFFPLHFNIMPLEAYHLWDFVQFYCQTAHCVEKVAEYIETNAGHVTRVPLILTFVCFLADSVQEIPTSITRLYDSLLRQMIKREYLHGKLEKSIDIETWKESQLVKTTAELAYSGFRLRRYEFAAKSLKEYHVTDDSFVCGFLLQKFDSAHETLAVEFPHRSIQEFFAALHWYQLMLSSSKVILEDATVWSRSLTTDNPNQFGRFFFGICSTERRFHQMINWLSPSILPAIVRPVLDPSIVPISAFGEILVDCTSEDHRILGQRLFESAGELRNADLCNHLRFIPTMPIFIDDLSKQLRSALHLGLLNVEKAILPLCDFCPNHNGERISERSEITVRASSNWFLAANVTNARLAVVNQRLLMSLLERKFHQIDILISVSAETEMHQAGFSVMLIKLKTLPSVKTLALPLRANYSATTTVTVCIRYAIEISLNLTNFRFEYERDSRNELLRIIEKEQFVNLTVDERNDFGFGTYILLKVTVAQGMSQVFEANIFC